MISNFNLRVYGLLVHKGQVLVSKEERFGREMLKFPGGGLEKGEGLSDGLMREFQEELKIKPFVGDLFYVNEFLQVSAFNPKDQLISFYYFVHYDRTEEIPTNVIITEEGGGQQIFHWLPISELEQTNFTFPIDQIVADLLRNKGY